MVAACNENPTTPPPQVERRALDPIYVIYPHLSAPGPVVLRCGFIVGPDSSWTLESARVRLDDYHIIVEGTAIRLAGVTTGTSAARFDSVTLTTAPLLEPTRYDLIVGELKDDLWIHDGYPPQASYMMALGGICPPHITMYSCYQFEPVHPAALAARGWLVENWPALTGCASAVLYAEILGRVSCTPLGEDNAFAFRKVMLR
jgi:hypothetical protein